MFIIMFNFIYNDKTTLYYDDDDNLYKWDFTKGKHLQLNIVIRG